MSGQPASLTTAAGVDTFLSLLPKFIEELHLSPDFLNKSSQKVATWDFKIN